jgi:hypothetical protein
MRFPSAEKLLALHGLEKNLRGLSESAANNAKYFSDKKLRAMDLARSRAFWGAANLVADMIAKDDRRI